MEYLLKSSAVIILFYTFYKLFLQKETFFEVNRWFLVSGLILSITIPLIVIPIYIVQEVPTFIENTSYSTNSVKASGVHLYTLNNILLLIYLIGVLILLSNLIYQLWSLGKIFNHHEKQKINKFTFIKTNKNITPFSFFKWIVYNPDQYDSKELEQIIMHETIHAQQLHSIDILLVHISTILFWFNPFMWLYKKDIEQNLEYIADDKTQQKVTCKKSYQTLLLKTSIPNYQIALANNFFNSTIKKRIVMLHKNKSNKRNLLKVALILPLIAAFLMSFNTKEIVTYNNSSDEFIVGTEIEDLLITKDFTDSDFEAAVKRFKKLGVSLKFKGIKRNDNNEIIAIKIDFKSDKGSSGNSNTSGSDPINPIRISYNSNDGGISIGSPNEFHFTDDDVHFKVDKLHFKSKDHNEEHENVFIFSTDEDEDHDIDHNIMIFKADSLHKIKHSGNEKKVLIYSGNGKAEEKLIELKEGDDNNVFIIKKTKDGNISKKWVEEADSIIWTKKKGEKIIIKELKDSAKTKVITIKEVPGKNKIFINSDGKGKSPLIIIDGKEAPKTKLNDLDPDKIESMNVIKGDAAIKKYGDKAKDGVIEIITKE